MRPMILTLGGIAGVALLVAQAQAHPPGGPPPMGDGAIRAVMAMLHSGGLSDELRAANEQLTAQLLAPTAPDEATLRASLDKVATLRSALLDQQATTALAVRAMLSADQLAAAAAAPPPDHTCSAHPMP